VNDKVAPDANVDPDRLHRIYAAVSARDGVPGALNRLKAICHACVDLLPVSGAGIMLMANRAHQGTMYATDERIQRLEDLQNAAAEGPCIDSYNLVRPVLAADLRGADGRMWPLLSRAALGAGIAALFSFPLQVDDAAVGALDLYRQEPGPLTPDQIADARLLAAMATRDVLSMQATALPGSLPDQIADLSGDRTAIEQATGMVAAQTNSSVAEAALMIRREAVERNLALAEIARAVIARTLRMS
jgi:GAF domain-containing protein